MIIGIWTVMPILDIRHLRQVINYWGNCLCGLIRMKNTDPAILLYSTSLELRFVIYMNVQCEYRSMIEIVHGKLPVFYGPVQVLHCLNLAMMMRMSGSLSL